MAKYGNYWDETQVVVSRVQSYEQIPDAIFLTQSGTPAFLAIVGRMFLFVEIVPGTQATEQYCDLNGMYITGEVAKINMYKGVTHKFEEMKLVVTDTWPLDWFKLNTIPPLPDDPLAAYARAMSIIKI